MMIYLFADTLRLWCEHFLLKYVLFCCINIIVILFVLTSCEARKFCHDEYSMVKDSNETVLWVDYHYTDSPIVFSNSNCLDENGKSIKRICHNGGWIPEEPPLCDRVSTNEHCPEVFYEYRAFCIIKYEPSLIKNIILLPKKLPNTGSNTNQTTCDEFQGDNVEYNLNINIKSKIENYSRTTSERHCNGSKYISIPYDHRFHLCPENCIPSELTSDNCFCKITGSSRHKLATVENVLQKKILSKLAGSDLCNIDTNYPSEICHCQSVITHNFYGYTLNATNCSIIETKALKYDKTSTASMVLTFNDRKRKLILLIENSKYLSPSNHLSVKCFTNAGTDRIRNVRIRKIKTKNEATSNSLAIFDISLEKYIGEYWCEAFSLNFSKIESNKILAYREKTGNEYSLRLLIKNVTSHFESNDDKIKVHAMQMKLSSVINKFVRVEVRFMEFFELDLREADLLLHLSTKKRTDISNEYLSIKEKLQRLPNYIEVVHLTAAGYCLPDATENTLETLHWELTKIWERAISKELCFQDNGLPVTRLCRGDFVSGAYWSEISGNCSKNIELPDVTKFLHQSLYTNISSNLIENVTSLTSNISLSYLDIYFYSELIKKVNVDADENSTTVQNVFKIINNLSNMNQTELSASQILFNATDTLLLLLDSSSEYSKINESYLYSDKNILIKSVYPFQSNISGLYLLGKVNVPLKDMKIFYLYRNQTIEDINLKDMNDLDLAVNIPDDVLKSIEVDSEDPSKVQVIFTVFYEDSLFVGSKKKSAGKVVSVTIPGYGTYLNDSIPIVMRSSSIYSDDQCGYWNLGQNLQRQQGEWSSFGGKYSGNLLNNSNLHVCHFSHLTHFALLIISEHIRVEEGDQEVTEFSIEDDSTNFNLTIITLVGGALSAVGVLGIYLTALVFSQWRAKEGTKILLNLSTAIFLEIILLQFSGATQLSSDSTCKLIGCLLHYTLLSKFCWMLIYALLQYRRFVKVFGVAPKNLILKSMLFGWGIALIPVILTLIITPESYSKTTICYLHGLPLYIAIIFPAFVVILSNLIVFITVMYNVSTRNVESTVENKFSVLQLYLAILLFSVLGLPWLFAIIAEFVTHNVIKNILMYFFCATGTLQGFILFIFYVLINEETRQKWRRYFKNENK